MVLVYHGGEGDSQFRTIRSALQKTQNLLQ
jgi:hypothetical protein